MSVTEPKLAEPDAGAKPAVLIVEDEKPLLDVYVAALSPSFEVATALNGAEADAILRERAFKVVLADNLMPGGNGLELLTRTRAAYPHMQRILITGYLKPDLMLRSATEAAVFRLLQKPIRIAELLGVVEEAARAHDRSVAAARQS